MPKRLKYDVVDERNHTIQASINVMQNNRFVMFTKEMQTKNTKKREIEKNNNINFMIKYPLKLQ